MADIPQANPYDRRREGRSESHDGYEIEAMESRPSGPPRALAIEDLDALACSAHERGQQAATDHLIQLHREERLAAQREAWNDGRQVGLDEGRAALLASIDEQYGAKVHTIHERGMKLLNVMGDEPRKATKAELERELDSAVDMLSELIGAHHDGFTPPIPF